MRKDSLHKAMHGAASVLTALAALATLQIAAATRLPQLSLPATSRFAEEEYGVLLDNTGPRSQAPIPVMAPTVMTEPIVEATKFLPHAPIPQSRVVSQQCFCIKTISRPQVFRRVIAVPQLVRFVKKTYRPVVEKIPFCAKPVAAKAKRRFPAGFTSVNRPSARRPLDDSFAL